MDRLAQAIHFCTSRDNLRLAYATTGQGPPLVRAAHFLTHLEFDVDSPVWDPWLAELSNDRLLVRYDGRGCGLSDRTLAPLSLEAWVADLEAVVDACSRSGGSLLALADIGEIVLHPPLHRIGQEKTPLSIR
jgi:pimeloyl-ACP methyl ester carboxylesterase